MDIVEKALIFAAKAHNGATRKGSTLPYIIHPAECVAIAASLTEDPEILAAAALHDTVEDTYVTEEMLLQEFGEKVMKLVCADSEDKMKERPAAETWKLRKQATIDALSDASEQEKIVILSDKLSNLRSIDHDYEILGEALWERFNQKDKKMHEWYYRSVLAGLSSMENTSAYRECLMHIDRIFK
ncbi:MAG: HD domain-containing protein [Lachnospiraceae bacterium]|nr:HD domain-containing protein [Lachnospiraceae bacterium]